MTVGSGVSARPSRGRAEAPFPKARSTLCSAPCEGGWLEVPRRIRSPNVTARDELLTKPNLPLASEWGYIGRQQPFPRRSVGRGGGATKPRSVGESARYIDAGERSEYDARGDRGTTGGEGGWEFSKASSERSRFATSAQACVLSTSFCFCAFGADRASGPPRHVAAEGGSRPRLLTGRFFGRVEGDRSRRPASPAVRFTLR
jgi:hypothetical protein